MYKRVKMLRLLSWYSERMLKPNKNVYWYETFCSNTDLFIYFKYTGSLLFLLCDDLQIL